MHDRPGTGSTQNVGGVVDAKVHVYWHIIKKRKYLIAAVLLITPGTVRKHLENAYGKLGVHTRTAAVRVAFRDRDL